MIIFSHSNSYVVVSHCNYNFIFPKSNCLEHLLKFSFAIHVSGVQIFLPYTKNKALSIPPAICNNELKMDHMDFQLFQHHLLKRLSCLCRISLALLLKINWPSMQGLFLDSLVFRASICLSIYIPQFFINVTL